jgi:hypothetical protein
VEDGARDVVGRVGQHSLCCRHCGQRRPSGRIQKQQGGEALAVASRSLEASRDSVTLLAFQPASEMADDPIPDVLAPVETDVDGAADPANPADSPHDNSADDAALPTKPLNKKKKKKRAKKPVSELPPPPAAPEIETKPSVLCISRNKHWRYISSYHVRPCPIFYIFHLTNPGPMASTPSRAARLAFDAQSRSSILLYA